MSYKTLIADLKSHLDAVDRYDISDSASKAILKAFWTVGRETFAYTRETGTPIKNIALDVGAGSGALEKYVRFYQQFPNGYWDHIDGHPLTWSHYAAVLYVADKKEREFYLKNAALQGWSSQEIRLRIRNNYYENHQGGQGQKKKAGTQLKKIPQQLYTYSAKVLKVIDADTFDLDIDIGFKIKIEHNVRLRGINCPERKTPKGERAKLFVEQSLGITPQSNATPLVVIRSYKSEKFGRYLVDLWYLKGETGKEEILKNGKLLNQILLDKGLAQLVE